jgi:hypothetical protein
MIRIAVLLLITQDPLAVEKGEAAVTVKAGGKELLGYQLKKPAGSPLSVDSACYFHPFATPKGVVVTDVAPADHLHHRGIFLAWVEMHGKKSADFWGWGQYAPKKDRVIVNRSAEGKGGGGAELKVRNEWTADGEALVKEDLEAVFTIQGTSSVLDLTYTLTVDQDLRLPRWAFSGFCLRARKDGKAVIVNPDGEVKRPAPNHMKPETDWPAAPWYGYNITLPDGDVVGTAVVDHPRNPPSLWHNAASIRMLNPCVVAPKELVIKAGEPLVLRYRCVATDGPLPAALPGW